MVHSVELLPYLLGTLAGQAPSYIIFPYIGSVSKDLLSAFFSDKGFSSVLGFWGTVAWFGFLIVANILLTAWITIVTKRELKKAMLEIEEAEELEAALLDGDDAKLLRPPEFDQEQQPEVAGKDSVLSPSTADGYVPIRSPSPYSLELVVVAGDDATSSIGTPASTPTTIPTTR